MEAIRQAVLTNKADLGIIFDTDVDRMSAVLPNGDDRQVAYHNLQLECSFLSSPAKIHNIQK